MTVAATSKAFFSKAYFSYHANGSLYRCALGSAIIPLAGKLHLQGTHSHFRVHSLKKGVSENEAPGPVGAYTTIHNDTTTHTETHTFESQINVSPFFQRHRMGGDAQSRQFE